MVDPLSLEQLNRQRKAVVKKLETMVKKGASAEEFAKTEKYLKLLDRRIDRYDKDAETKANATNECSIIKNSAPTVDG